MLCTYLALHVGLQCGMDMLGIMLGSVRVMSSLTPWLRVRVKPALPQEQPLMFEEWCLLVLETYYL